MHEMTPAPGERLMSHDATKKASQVDSDTGRAPVAKNGYINRDPAHDRRACPFPAMRATIGPERGSGADRNVFPRRSCSFPAASSGNAKPWTFE
jgi:hypothetical protein